jgi:YhcG PDDEXK nuclease domain
VRELKRQMKSMLFHRLALSTDKQGIIKLANNGHEIHQPEDLLKDPFVLEFLKHFRLDLLFYHRILKCFVLIGLKRGELDHSDVGQMNLYLNYFKKEEATEGDNEPVGILLGAYKDHILVEYATSSITNKVLLAKYQLYLPDKTQLENTLGKLLDL